MHINNKTLLICLSIFLTLFPYTLINSYFSITYQQLENASLLLLQFVCILFLTISYLRIKPKPLKLFWQYISLAIASPLISNILFNYDVIDNNLLLKEFFILFSYFFILLAIETTPHVAQNKVERHIISRITTIFFTLFCFSYLVLLPFEFANDVNNKVYSSELFHCIVTGLITVKLIVMSYLCHHKFWCKIYTMLSIAASAIFIDTSIAYASHWIPLSLPEYFQSLLIFLPYSALILAANFSLPEHKEALTTPANSIADYPLIILTFFTILMHLTGSKFNLHFYVHSDLQLILLVIWLMLSFTMFSIVMTKKNKDIQQKFQTIKQQQLAQEKLVSLNHQLTKVIINSEDKAIVGVSNNAILTATVNGQILSANPAAIQMFQCLEHDLIKTHVGRFFSKEDEMHYFFDFQSNIHTLQRKETGISVECTAIKKDGSTFPVQAELQWAEREETPLVVITFINLTERKLAERQTLDLKDKFIANISHEFRTPLTIINGILDQYLQKSHTLEEGKELKTAKRNGLRLVRMVEQLLELSRLADNPQLTLSTYRLKTLMAMPTDSFSRLALQNQLVLDCNIADDIWLDCDAQAFEKIVFNLLANAIKYTPSGGKISILSRQEQEHFILDIIDTGIGISSTAQTKIFERFHRADENQGVFGVGIGLSLVHELVKAHHWQIKVISEHGKGSKFSLYIPCALPLNKEVAPPTSISQTEVSSLIIEQKDVPHSKALKAQKVVLVIEDNQDMQVHIKQVIEQKHHCIIANSGEQGLKTAQEYIPDLIVCDIMLQGIDGFAVLKQLKSHELTSHIPVILLTARSDLDSRLQGLNLQADEYLSKPFNHLELLTRIGNLIQGREQLQKSYLVNLQKDLQSDRKSQVIENATELSQSKKDELSLDNKFLEKLETITANVYMNTDLDIVQLATHMAMSERQLQRKLKVLMGVTPNQFIKEFRLKKAKVLLQNGSQIGRIALDVGFSSQTYFGRCFKEMFACTPKQYQQQYLNKERHLSKS